MDLTQVLVAMGNPRVREAVQDPMLLYKLQQNPKYLDELVQLTIGPPLQPSAPGLAPAPSTTTVELVPKELLYQLLDAYAETDEGRRFVSLLGRFASFAQSEMAKRDKAKSATRPDRPSDTRQDGGR